MRRRVRLHPVRLGALLFALWFIAAAVLAAPAGAATGINGGGSGFAALEMDQWRADTARAPYNLTVNYVAQGSSFGRQQFMQGTLDYATSDIVFQPIEIGTLTNSRCGGNLPGCFVYVPVSAGGLSFMYNLVDAGGQRVNNLKLTRDAACGIFTGTISKWNDPKIVATNPQLSGLSQSIVPVIRSDGAGESYVFSEFCLSVAPSTWGEFVNRVAPHGDADSEFNAGHPTSNWPQQWYCSNCSQPSRQLGADGVANVVADPVTGKNSITYVAAGYAKVRSFPVASLQNAAGQFTQPDEENVTVALGYASPRNDPATNTVGTFVLNFTGPDPRAYFPSTYSYVIAQTRGFDPGKGATLGQFLCYAVSKGQEIAVSLRYARLSQALVDISINAIGQIPGAPSKDQCFIAGAAAPPGAPTVVGGPAAGPTAAAAGGTADAAGAVTPEQAAQQAAAQQAAAQAAAEQAAAEKAAAAQAAKQAVLKKKLAAFSNPSVSTGDSGPDDWSTVWTIGIGAAVGAGISAFAGARKRLF
jgi:phosphate transport system substrate-binding protein